MTFVANPFYQQRVQRSGSRFVSAGSYLDMFAALEANPRYLRIGTGAVAIWKELVAPSIRDTYPVVRDAVRATGASAVVSHVLSYGGVWAATETGVRNVVVTTTASAWLSRHQPMVFANWRAPRAVQGALSVALRRLGEAVLRRALRPLSVASGAPVRAGVVPDADLNLGVWPEWFRPSAPDDPPHAKMCGFVFDAVDAVQPLARDARRLSRQRRSAGGRRIRLGGEPARRRALSRRRRRVRPTRPPVCADRSLGGRGDPHRDLHVVAAAPYARLFPAAAAVVHHGGFGTCAEVLRAGKSSLVTPFVFDQFDTAARLDDAGLGCWYRGGDGAGAMAAALDPVLHSEPIAAAARDAARKIAAAPGGADRAAEIIEAAAMR